MKNDFLTELSRLTEASKDAVIDGSKYSLDEFKEYMHVERPIEKSLAKIIEKAAHVDGPQLVLVCGNVGDGKSHVISRLSKTHAQEVKQFTIHNDATEAHNPSESFNSTLNRVLDNFSDPSLGNVAGKVLLAINLGTLANFLDKEDSKFKQLAEFVKEKQILDEGFFKTGDYDEGSYFQYVNFTDFQLYELSEGGPTSPVLESVFAKILNEHPRNAIFKAYQTHIQRLPDGLFCPIRFNYEFLGETKNRKLVLGFVIQAIVQHKEIVSLRNVLNFVFELVVPAELRIEDFDDYVSRLKSIPKHEYLRYMVFNYLFEHPNLSKLFQKIARFDPTQFRSSGIDEQYLALLNTADHLIEFKNSINSAIRDDQVLGKSIQHLSDRINDDSQNSDFQKSLLLLLRSYSRLLLFLGDNASTIQDPDYRSFILQLFHWHRGEKKAVGKMHQLVWEAARLWNGNPIKSELTILDIGAKQRRFRIKSNFPKLPIYKGSRTSQTESKKIINFVPHFKVAFGKAGKETISISVDYGLYVLLRKIIQGYRPNKLDRNSFVSFADFVHKVNQLIDEKESIYIDEVNKGSVTDYELSYNLMQEYVEFKEMNR